MKIMFVDTARKGHSEIYLETLASQLDDVVYVLPKNSECKSKGKVYYTEFWKYNRSWLLYFKWIMEIKRIAKSEKPDVIHFMSGDDIYRYMGFGLSCLNRWKRVMTFHQIREGILRKIGIMLMCNNIEIGVVHTRTLFQKLQNMNIRNIVQIEYPSFRIKPDNNLFNLRGIYNIPNEDKIILLIGVLNKYKGVEILLEAIKRLDGAFTLIIAGMPKDYDERYIKEYSGNMEEKVKTHLEYIDDAQYTEFLYQSDVIVLPYQKNFNGASGPLADGVYFEKCIIGSNHGSLGQIIKDNHLGYVFETGNSVELGNVLNKAIKNTYLYDSVALKYKEAINVKTFKRKYLELYMELKSDKRE